MSVILSIGGVFIPACTWVGGGGLSQHAPGWGFRGVYPSMQLGGVYPMQLAGGVDAGVDRGCTHTPPWLVHILLECILVLRATGTLSVCRLLCVSRPGCTHSGSPLARQLVASIESRPFTHLFFQAVAGFKPVHTACHQF